MVRLDDSQVADDCSGTDTSLSFIQQYFMKSSTIQIDSIFTSTIHKTHHNFVNQSPGNLTKVTGCPLTNPNVHYNPDISLDKEAILCKGTNRQLTAGSGYSQYLWSNSSTDSSILVSDTGKYWVSVTDQYGCKGSDTTFIVAIASLPVAFIPHDTSLCLGGHLTINPLGDYKQYLWSDFSSGSVLTVSQPGMYWLQVTDSNNCVGTDTMQVNQSRCLNEPILPSAFTPNGDGLNDQFKPLLSGNVIKFIFTIYNRWGEKVFETQSLQRGWDGKLNGVFAASGVFIWYCQYQFAGQALKRKKGTVMLIR